jgi:hypothetical protein
VQQTGKMGATGVHFGEKILYLSRIYFQWFQILRLIQVNPAFGTRNKKAAMKTAFLFTPGR